MTAAGQRLGVSAAQATIIAAIISAIIGPSVVAFVKNRKPNIPVNPPSVAKDFKETPRQPERAPLSEVIEGVPGGMEARGCAPLGRLQICWGNAKFNPRNDAATPVCDFAMAFARPFAAKPSVTVALQGETSGYAYAVYSQQVTTGGISGGGLEVLRRASNEPVVVSYVAIGLPAGE
jgi:hypothetical protein